MAIRPASTSGLRSRTVSTANCADLPCFIMSRNLLIDRDAVNADRDWHAMAGYEAGQRVGAQELPGLWPVRTAGDDHSAGGGRDVGRGIGTSDLAQKV